MIRDIQGYPALFPGKTQNRDVVSYLLLCCIHDDINACVFMPRVLFNLERAGYQPERVAPVSTTDGQVLRFPLIPESIPTCLASMVGNLI